VFLLEFGGHPVLHHYNYKMFRRQQEELLRQAEYERLIRAAEREQRRNRRLYRNFANWLGTHMVQWGRKLEHFGDFREARPDPSPSPHH
jgi:hemerythrin